MKLALALAFFIVVACEDASRAIDPVWGKQACAHCAMLLSEPRFAAELTTIDGDRLFFDDVGCMAAYVGDHEVALRAMWVRTSNGAWVDAKSARFKTGSATPMDYGFEASLDGAATWDDITRADTARGARR